MRTTKKVVDNKIVQRIIETMERNGVRQKDLMENIGLQIKYFQYGSMITENRI